VVETGKPSPVNVGIVSQYHKSGDTLSLRFISPEKPGVSETLAVIEIKDTSLVSDHTLENLMQSLKLPEDSKPEFSPKKPKSPRA
jgi:hypothetical protein